MSEYTNNNADLGSEIGWDDEITRESEFVLLPEGNYDFTVESLERGRFAGSEKMSPCNMATLTLVVKNPETGEDVKIKDTLYLNSKAEWRISQFFLGIGQKKHGEPLRPNWNAVPGSKGRLELTVNTYQKDGESRKNNRVSKYLEHKPAFKAGTF